MCFSSFWQWTVSLDGSRVPVLLFRLGEGTQRSARRGASVSPTRLFPMSDNLTINANT